LALLGAGFSLFAAQAAFAQDATTTKTDDTLKLETFTVTGSFLPVSASVGASPVVTIQASDIGQSGATDPLRLLRQLTPYFMGNGNVGTELDNGGTGESNVSLRNLPTLVLLNGVRFVGSANSSGSAVDLNTIPTAMIDHIDILKDGASTVYGSDAIGGVVNIILKKNYNGFESGVAYGEDKSGAYKTRDAYVMGGATGQGFSITLSAEHFENTPLLTTSVPLTTLTPAQINALGFNVTSAVYSGTYPGRAGNDVLAGSTLIATGATGFNAAITSPTYQYGVAGQPYGFVGQTLAQLQAAGTYLVVANTPIGMAAGGPTALNTTLFGNPIIVATKRNQFTTNFEKELVGKSLVVFGDFLYAQTANIGTGLAPSPIAGVGAGGPNNLTIPANNPYNPFGVTLGIGQAAGATSVRTRLIEFGKRDELSTTDTWRFVGGLKGDFNDKYSWSVTYNYSSSTNLTLVYGGANGNNMNLAMIPEVVNNNYVYNAAGRPLSMLTDSSGNNLPVYNYFALPGFNDPATIAAIETTLFNSAQSYLKNLRYVITGKPFELPAGDFTFALGAETYREDIASQVDGIFANNLALGYTASATFNGGSRSTRGAFLETGIPITSPSMNVPFFNKLDLTVADRYEQIQPGGNANVPKVGILWHPVDDQFVIRSTWSKGFIAPSIFALYGPPQGSASGFSILAGNGSSGSGGSLGTITSGQFGNTTFLSNPNLPPSNSESYTAGFVYSPKQLKGFSVSVDYYHIKEDHVGGADLTGVYADLNAKGSASIYAAGFTFADGTHLTSTAPNQLTSTNVGNINLQANPAGKQRTDGMDITVDYQFNTAEAGRWDIGAMANYLMNYQFQDAPGNPYVQYAGYWTDTYGGVGTEGLLPKYTIKPYISNTYKSLQTSIFLNYVPTVKAPGSLFPTQSNLQNYTTDVETLNGLPWTIPSYFTADLGLKYTLPSFGKDWARNMSITLSVNNVFDKKAPYVPGGGVGASENNTVKGVYDVIGRIWTLSLKKAF
jgi:iron complex outermembrane receptor protein